MASDLKNGALWTPPTFTDDGTHNNDPAYIAANGSHGLNGVTAETLAAQRLAFNSLGSVANVREFGAKGDGATNDTAAFAAAIATGRHIIFVPAGAYVITPNILVFGAQSLVGVGPVRNSMPVRATSGSEGPMNATSNLYPSSSASPLLRWNAVAGYMLGINIWGQPTSTSQILAHFENTSSAGGYQVNDGIIHNCWFGHGGTAIYGVKLQGFTISNCAFETSTVCADLNPGYNNIFTGNIFYGGGGGTAGVRGLVLRGGSTNTTIVGNNIECFPRMATPAATSAGVVVESATNTTISGNIFSKNSKDITISAASTDIAISGNTFETTQNDSVTVDGASRVVVNGNTWGAFAPYLDTQNFPRTAGCAVLRTVGTAKRVMFTNNIALGDATRTNGVLLSAGTTKSLVDNFNADGIATPVTDAGSTNVVGRVVT